MINMWYRVKTHSLRVTDPVKWKEIRERIILRDKSTCRFCGEYTNKPEVHHKKNRFRKLQDLDKDRNLVTLCYRCHKFGHGFFMEKKKV